MAFHRTGKRESQRGSTALEFALVTLAAIPMLFGTVGLGIILAEEFRRFR